MPDDWTPKRSWVPNSLTLANAVCGFAAMAVLTQGADHAMYWAGVLVFVGWAFDMVDGMVARKLGVSGPFGAVLDSLCDVVSFGALPALATFVCARVYLDMSAFGAVAAVVFLACAVLRLARFTAQAGAGGDKAASRFRVFQGLSSPAAAMAVAACMITWPAATPFAALIVAPLMVSSQPYPDLGHIYIVRALPIWHLAVPLVAIFVLGPGITLLAFFAAYILGGPVLATWLQKRTLT